MACLQIYRELLSLTTFLRVHSNSKEVSYLSWQNTYPNLKTTCHIKLKFFLWTKLIENLLLAKYLISVTAPLTVSGCYNANVRLITYLNNKTLLTCVENITLWWIMENKKLSDENQRFDWLILVDSLILTYLFDLMIWLV